MKIRDIISEDQDREMDKRFAAWARRREEDKRRKKVDPNATGWAAVKQAKRDADRATDKISDIWDRFSRHPLVKPK